MADINLLSTDSQKFNFAQKGVGLLIKALLVVLALVLLYYGYLWVQISRTNKAVQAAQVKTSQVEAEALTRKDRAEIVTRQGQLQSLDGLIKNHLYWSGLLPELARVSLKSASYTSFTAEAAGTLSLDVAVPTYADADKYIQVFNLPQFNQQFSDVKVLSIGKVQQGSTEQINMKLEVKFNPDFIRKTFK